MRSRCCCSGGQGRGELQCIEVYRSVSQHVAVCCSVLQCVTVCCSVLQCVAVCCSDYFGMQLRCRCDGGQGRGV